MSNICSVENLLNGVRLVHNDLIYIPKYKIISRQDNKRNDKNLIKIICGGGSGHEPAFAGYVGYGMLTTAVAGDLFSSPSVNSIIQSVLITGDNETNILMVVLNYTGDRINFGLAKEILESKYNYKNIKMILINDDISIDEKNVQTSVGKRGLAGTIILIKIIGAMAETGFSLNQIVDFIETTLNCNNLCTMGFTFKSNLTTGLHDIEIGKGIHGEPGINLIKHLNDFNQITEILLQKFLNKIEKNSKVILLINNLGGTSEFLMNIFYSELLKKFSEFYTIMKILTGTFLTSLGVEGISVTLLKSDEDLIKYLEFETNIPSNVFGTNSRNHLKNMKSILINENDYFHNDPIQPTKCNNVQFTLNPIKTKEILEKICNVILQNSKYLDEIDSEFGDGDTGTTLSNGANAILSAIERNELKTSNPTMFLLELSQIIYENMGGTSGGIYGLFLSSASKAFLNESPKQNNETWLYALTLGIEAVIKYGWSNEGNRTILDPLIAGKRALNELKNINDTENGIIFKTFASACKKATENTIKMQPKSGRSAYTFSENKTRTIKYPDSGAYAVSLWSNALYEVMK